MNTKKISATQAHEYWRATGGCPHYIFNNETNKYERYVEYSGGQKLGPFLNLNDYKKASINAYIHKFRVVPTY